MSDFYPVTPIVVITNTSYAAQAGVLGEQWAVRVVRGRKIIAEKPINELALDSIVGMIYGHIRIEGLGRHAVAQTAGRLMQFSRRYQTSGVCPNYADPNLVYGDEVETSPTAYAEPETTVVEPEMEVTPVEELPKIPAFKIGKAWAATVEVHSVMIARMAAYGAALPEGHLESMFEQTASDLIDLWFAQGDAFSLIYRFAAMIQSCSRESTVSESTKSKIIIETVNCALLESAGNLKKAGIAFPSRFPCKFHEEVAKQISARTKTKISINTTSSGCTVTIVPS
jgi:hypothetical protein